MTKYIDITGVIVSSNEDYEHLEKLLEDNGFSFYGAAKDLSDQKILKVTQSLANKLPYSNITKALKEAHNVYSWVKNTDDLLETLSNTGTGNYYQIIESLLSEEDLKVFKSYSDRNWVISDVFESYFYDAMEKILKGGK